jgi:hypothetical protein
MPPIACPYCDKSMVRRLQEPHDFNCQEHGWMSAKYVAACGRSAHLQTIQFSPSHMRVHPLLPGDEELIVTLFAPEDRQYDAGRRAWQVTNIEKYAHIKCVQTAQKAFSLQGQLW